MHLATPSRLLLACSLAFMPFSTVSWEITMSDLEEKDIDEFHSSGLKCPTCYAVRGRKCHSELKWCSKDKIKCVEFSGIINTGIRNISIKVKKCVTIDLCNDTVTAYMGFPITNKTFSCKSAIRNGARATPRTLIFFFILFLKKVLH